MDIYKTIEAVYGEFERIIFSTPDPQRTWEIIEIILDNQYKIGFEDGYNFAEK